MGSGNHATSVSVNVEKQKLADIYRHIHSSKSSSNMAELRRAEKLASAKKKLRQFQQKNRDSQSESGRSTPTKKKSEEEDSVGKLFRSENGGSSNSLSQSENFSICGTDSPVPALENHSEVLKIFNGSSQPDIINVSSVIDSSKSYFQTSSPQHLFSETPPPPKNKSAAEFFDNLSSSYEASNKALSFGSDVPSQMPLPILNMTGFRPPHINASTPEGPMFQDTPNYSFPDASVSPIVEMKNTSRDGAVSNLEQKLSESQARNVELEQQLNEQKTHIIQLQTHLEEMKKKTDEGASALKHHVQAIEILVSEKTELQNSLDKKQEEVNVKNGEAEELQGRLRASRHRVTELERDLGSSRAHAAALESSVTQLTARANEATHSVEALRKHVGDLELEVSDLQNKLEMRDQTMAALQSELAEKTSQLSLAQVRVQQLSGGLGSDTTIDQLQKTNEELSRTVEGLEARLSSAATVHEQSVRDYQRYVEQLQAELTKLKASEEMSREQMERWTIREQQLVQQVSELERQLNRAPQPVEDPAARELREQLTQAQATSQQLQLQLEHKSHEVDCLREGLQERALRIQELEAAVERLEAERPDAVNLQAAIESDKVAASRAVAQNTNLKKQLEELQEALVKLSNSKLELTQQLQYEQHLSKDLSEKLERIQDSKQTSSEVEKCQQTETPALQEAEVQTNESQPVVSPEAMTKLEEKFRRTMVELADLSDEKQRLEHLVLQLQSETETIGEYITLYQIQRGMLRQRAQEKDEQVARLAQDKEALRNKLAQLNSLVQQLVGGSGGGTCPEQHQLNGHDAGVPEVAPPGTAPEATAHQIRSLLTEIGSSSLVTGATDTNINFHPCPWCSGRLITV